MADKGPSFERWFCDRLSEWWTGDPDASVFWRTANSGGRATVRGRKGKRTGNHHGDVCAIDPSGDDFLKVFCVELKRGYGRLSVQDFLDVPDKKQVTPRGKKPPASYWHWVEKAETCREAAGALTWMLAVKRDKREPLVMFPAEHLYRLADAAPEASASVGFRLWGEGVTAFVGRLEWFFDNVSPGRVRELAGEWRLRRGA